MKKENFKYGIKITKPHSAEMYDWNDNIANIMKQEIKHQIEKAYINEDFKHLNELIELCAGIQYSEGHSIEELYSEVKELVENVPNYWLNQEWDWAVNLLALVRDVLFDSKGRRIGFVGFNK